MIQSGDVVRWKPEYAQSEEERAQTFYALEVSDGTCYIKPTVWGKENRGILIPALLTKIEYLEKAL